MQVNSVPLIKFLGTMTVPATGTESVGLPADALLPRFLLSHLDSFIMTRQILNIYHKCHHYTYSLTRQLSSVYRDKQKPRQPATRTAIQLYHRAVMLQFPKNSGQPFPRLPRISLRLYLENFMTHFLDLYTLINPLSYDGRKQAYTSGKLNFNTVTDFIHRDNDRCSINPPACPSLFAYGNSRFCFFEIYKTGP